MEVTNNQRVSRGMDLLREGLRPYVKRQFRSRYKNLVQRELQNVLNDRLSTDDPFATMDADALLKLMIFRWSEVFGAQFGESYPPVQTLARECRSIRIHYDAHRYENCPSADAYRALDTIHRLLVAISAKEAAAVQELCEEQFEILAREGNVVTQHAIQEILEEALELTQDNASESDQSARPLLEEALRLTKTRAATLREVVSTGRRNALTRLDFRGKAHSIASRLPVLRGSIQKRTGQWEGDFSD